MSANGFGEQLRSYLCPDGSIEILREMPAAALHRQLPDPDIAARRSAGARYTIDVAIAEALKIYGAVVALVRF